MSSRLSLCLILVCLLSAYTTSRAFAREVVEDSKLLVAFDTASGALTRMADKTTGWEIEKRPKTWRCRSVWWRQCHLGVVCERCTAAARDEIPECAISHLKIANERVFTT